MDTLLKFAHDLDHEVVLSSIVSLGLIGAGTNNARIASMLRQLVSFHRHTIPAILAIRLAQGLVHLGKGAMTLSPLQFDRQVINANAFVGLMTFIVAMLEPKSIMHKRHFMTMILALAIQPRYLLTRTIVDKDTLDDGNPDETYDTEATTLPVRVGQAVDVVGQAGQPRTITGFQTHQTPVLLAHGERAELAGANEQRFSVLSSFLEGVVLVRKKDESNTTKL